MGSLFDAWKKEARPPEKRMAALIEAVRENSPTGKTVLDASINEQGTQFVFAEGLMSALGSYFPDSNTVFLNPRYSDDALCSTIVHEARHSLQKRFEEGNLKSLILMSRTCEADASAHGCAAAFEMRTARPAVWKAFKAHSPRMALAYEASITAGPKEALAEAFKSWFDSRNYVGRYDSDSIMRAMAGKLAPKRAVSSRNLLSAACARSPFGVYVDAAFLDSDRALTVKRGTAFELRMAGLPVKDRSFYDFKIPRLVRSGVREIKRNSFAAKAAAFLAPRDGGR